jgi:hypothetical protein
MKVITIFLAVLASSAHAKSENIRNNKEENFVVRNYANITRLGDILNLFDINKVGASWKEVNLLVNRNCARDMSQYLDGLEEKRIWALKSE